MLLREINLWQRALLFPAHTGFNLNTYASIMGTRVGLEPIMRRMRSTKTNNGQMGAGPEETHTEDLEVVLFRCSIHAVCPEFNSFCRIIN
jgi:hypothetical protein